MSSTCEVTVKPALFVAPPDTELCRDDDDVYHGVLSVVKAITVMSKTVPDVPSEKYVDLVKVNKFWVEISTRLRTFLVNF